MNKIGDISGKKFNNLTAIRYSGKSKDGHTVWLFKCDCGKFKNIVATRVCSGKTKSCGCLFFAMASSCNKIHGLSNSRLFKIWTKIKERCYDRNAINYHNYGGRGIIICNEWKNNFKSFYNWAMDNGYREDLTIDRIDVNGNYCPENCRWATQYEQNRNRRNNFIIEYNGEKKCLAEWCDIFGIPYKWAWEKISVYGIGFDKLVKNFKE